MLPRWNEKAAAIDGTVYSIPRRPRTSRPTLSTFCAVWIGLPVPRSRTRCLVARIACEPPAVSACIAGAGAWVINLYPCTSPAVYCSTNNGNILEEDVTNSGVSGLKQTFSYDALNRLATATEKNSGGTTTWSETFSYDIYGNRWVSATTPAGLETAFTPTTSSNFNSANLLLTNGALYDLSGNQTTIGGYTNTYDAESRLATSTLNSITATYSYDGEGRRVQRVASGVTTQYAYDAQGQLTAEFSAQAPTVTGTEYLVADHLGSTRMTTNSSGGCLQLTDYLPFGEPRINTLGGRTGCYGTSDGVAEKFTGKEHDAETTLDFFGARYFSGAQGRFTSPDPLLNSGRPDDPQSWNRYAYVGNNPLRNIDPTGLYFFTNTCAESDQACNAAFKQTQANVQTMYASTQAAYDEAVKDGDTTAATALKRTLDGLGAEGKLNARGQTVDISVNLVLDAPGKTSFAKGSTSTINVVLNPDMSNGDQGAEAAAAHEGVHAGEIMPGTPTFNQAYGIEHDAYETESYFSQAIGFWNIHSPSNGSDVVNGVLDMSKDFVLWNPSWASADRTTIDSRRSAGINAAAKDGAGKDCQAGGCKP